MSNFVVKLTIKQVLNDEQREFLASLGYLDNVNQFKFYSDSIDECTSILSATIKNNISLTRWTANIIVNTITPTINTIPMTEELRNHLVGCKLYASKTELIRWMTELKEGSYTTYIPDRFKIVNHYILDLLKGTVDEIILKSHYTGVQTYAEMGYLTREIINAIVDNRLSYNRLMINFGSHR